MLTPSAAPGLGLRLTRPCHAALLTLATHTTNGRRSVASLVQAVPSPRWEVLDDSRVRLTATVKTEVQGYGDAVVDPREYPKDSSECFSVQSMAATYGELPPEEPQANGQPPLVQAVNMYEGEDEFAGEQAPHPPSPSARFEQSQAQGARLHAIHLAAVACPAAAALCTHV